MNNPNNFQSLIPTIVVGIGGTGSEVLLRVRRLVEETYGSLENFPIISFLYIDTDKGYRVSNPDIAGSPFNDVEKCHADVSPVEAKKILEEIDKYPWIKSWFPEELLPRSSSNLNSSPSAIRALGRFAFFYHYAKIQQDFFQALNRVKGRENYMLNRYGVKVTSNRVNVFVASSLCGVTGSGMLIDLGYCVQHWLQGQGSSELTAIVPMPNAFAGINVGSGVISNGYAALMELSYFSDPDTKFIEKYSLDDLDEIRSDRPPFDFTYLTGTKNGESEFRLSQLREMIAQQIYLSFTPSNIAQWKTHCRFINTATSCGADWDNEGRGYSKRFSCFGLSTIEIPIGLIRGCLSYRLGKDLVGWWLNESTQLPSQMLELVRGDILKGMRLTEQELIADLGVVEDCPITVLVSQWLNRIRNDIITQNLLESTRQGIHIMGREKGKILTFTNYLQDKVETFQAKNFKDIGSNERVHGELLQNMYRNRENIIVRGCQALEAELYSILEDRDRGVNFAEIFLTNVEQVFESTTEKFRCEQELQGKIEDSRKKQYEDALQDINELKNKFGIKKQAKMEQLCEVALTAIDGSVNALIRRKARALGLEVIVRLKEHLQVLERRLAKFQQRTSQLRDSFNRKAKEEANKADALKINGIKLYQREEFNSLYTDLIEQLAGVASGSNKLYDQELDKICTTVSQEILNNSSSLWKETRNADEVMRLFDLTEVPEVNLEDVEKIIYEQTKKVIQQAPEKSRLKQELNASDRIFKTFNDESEIVNRVRIAYQKSQPLMQLNKAMLAMAGFNPSKYEMVAVCGGNNSSNSATKKMLPIIRQFMFNADNIYPLGENEGHRIIFTQEMGGFSLRCIKGIQMVRKSYQKCLGESIIAKRAWLKDRRKALPAPVHITKAVDFWDFFPEERRTRELLVQATAFKILVQKNDGIWYQKPNENSSEKIYLASNWEEAIQVLEVRACLKDKQEIQRQVDAVYDAAKTEAQKQQLQQRLVSYLARRKIELEDDGDYPSFKLDNAIIGEILDRYKLSPISVGQVSSKGLQTEKITSAQPRTLASGNSKNKLEELKELKEMHEQGILTEEEFSTAKKVILGL